jgi:hypothetical protein
MQKSNIKNETNDNYFTLVEHSPNTSSIISLIIGLFYNSSSFYDTMLDQITSDLKTVYIQEIIKNNLIEPLRKKNIINIATTYELVNTLINFNLLDKKYYTEEVNPLILYKILNNISFEYVQNNENYSIPYIELNKELYSEYKNTTNELNLSSIVIEWFNKKLNIEKMNIEIKKIPTIIPIFLNKNEKKGNIFIDIKYQIKPLNYLDKYSNITFSIHSLVCYSSTENHYYTVMLIDKNWIIFDNKNIPCFKILDMKNKDISNKLKSEVVVVFYKYDDIIV